MAVALADEDCAAARLQLAELQLQYQCFQDNRLALQLFLEQDLDPTTTQDPQDPVDSLEEELLLEQIASLSNFITAAEDQQVALNSIHQEETQQAASLQLAATLEAQEQWDATVLRPHDAALARAIAGCQDWEEQGALLEDPVDLTGRPACPAEPGAGQNACLDFASAASGVTPQPPSSDHAGTAGSRSKGLAEWQTATQMAGSSMDECNRQQAGQLQCGICFEWCAADSMMSAALPAVMASSSRAAGCCNHKYCLTCMQQYVSCELQSRKFPICCPSPECDEEIRTTDVLQLLAGKPHMVQLYQALEAEALIDSSRRVYCPFKDCSVLLERPEGGEEGEPGGQQAPYECPVCHRSFCLSCGIAGWHEGMTCQQFQALPPDLRSAEDAAMLHIAKQHLWKRCPDCRHIVERTHGCNHMKCRCGCHFCYACGVRYKSTEPSANNAYGTQGCDCELFAVPQEAGAGGGRAASAVVLHQAAGHGRPWRNGRRVSRTPCRHAWSIHACPHGPDRCWFWHAEDSEDEDSDDL